MDQLSTNLPRRRGDSGSPPLVFYSVGTFLEKVLPPQPPKRPKEIKILILTLQKKNKKTTSHMFGPVQSKGWIVYTASILSRHLFLPPSITDTYCPLTKKKNPKRNLPHTNLVKHKYGYYQHRRMRARTHTHSRGRTCAHTHQACSLKDL